MTDRLHAVLDGDLSRESLSAGERAELDALEGALASVAASIRGVPSPDLGARVLAALPARPSLTARLAGWLWAPRRLELRFRPAVAGLALGCAVVLGLALGRGPAAVTVPSPTLASLDPTSAERAPAPAMYVQFRLSAPGARHVALAGTFTAWEPRHELYESAPGVWTVLVPLEPGVHDYVFVVDGTDWVPDPHAAQVDDSFGGTNSRIALASVEA
jgi:hypothetical protein